ncbi:ATP-binding protein [Candidatus Woesearchaeota archaeon]|nr:ATP-binding protein [Candidatus Woesearchaeota archaeon]
MAFINRKEELKLLKDRIASNKAEFIIIYGRRRVGKSEIINEILKQNYGLKLLAREESEELQLRKFSESLSTFLKDETLAKNHFKNWDAFFTYINERSKKRIIIALDEFPYLVAENKSITSILQDYWDNKLKNSKICLILCGSSISMMERLLGHKSPIYGRRTSQLLITPFSLKQALDYLNMTFEDAVKAYSVFGGTPAYVLEYNIKKDLRWNLIEKVLKKDSFLCRDVEFVLKEELREPRYYYSIISSVAKGNTKISEIINDTGLDKGIVGKYLSILTELMLIKREVPVTENPLKSRKGIYIISDNFFKFWFRFIYPNKETIENENYNVVIENIFKYLNDYIGHTFEDVCKAALEEMNRSNKINFSKINRWWYKDKEIDIVALNEDTKEIMFCECKWQDNVDAGKILNELKEKAKFVDWHNGNRKERYAIFAKSFKKAIKEKDLQMFDLKDIERELKK